MTPAYTVQKLTAIKESAPEHGLGHSGDVLRHRRPVTDPRDPRDVNARMKKEDTMRVFVAGASGALGSRLVPQLIDAGHDVIGSHNSPANAELLRALGAKPVLLDLLDAAAVRKAVVGSEPEAIVHQATALANVKFGCNFDKVFAATNELRTTGTDALLAAAREAGVRRFVAQSFVSYRYAREEGAIKTEEDRLDPAPPQSRTKPDRLIVAPLGGRLVDVALPPHRQLSREAVCLQGFYEAL